MKLKRQKFTLYVQQILPTSKEIFLGTYCRKLNSTQYDIQRSIFSVILKDGDGNLTPLHLAKQTVSIDEMDPDILKACESSKGYYRNKTPLSTKWLEEENLERIKTLPLFDPHLMELLSHP